MQNAAKKEKTPNIEEMRRLKIGRLAKTIAHAKAIGFAKWSVWVSSYTCCKHAKNDCLITLELLCAKSRSKKHQILEK